MNEWEDLTYATAERFGGTLPHPETAAAIAAVYHRAPHAVTRAIDQVADDYANGTIRSPWGILKARVQQITIDDAGKTKSNDRERAITRAEQRTRNELLHYDRPDEALDELFGERGTLRHHNNPKLHERMRTLWTELRPLGIATELDAEERGRRHIEQRQLLNPPAPAKTSSNITELIRQEIAESKAKLLATHPTAIEEKTEQ